MSNKRIEMNIKDGTLYWKLINKERIIAIQRSMILRL